MRVVVLYKQQTDTTRQVEEFMADFYRQTGRQLESIDPESPDCVSFCTAYDILEFPSLIAISDNGQLQNYWSGLPLPTISEVSYYV